MSNWCSSELVHQVFVHLFTKVSHAHQNRYSSLHKKGRWQVCFLERNFQFLPLKHILCLQRPLLLNHKSESKIQIRSIWVKSTMNLTSWHLSGQIWLLVSHLLVIYFPAVLKDQNSLQRIACHKICPEEHLKISLWSLEVLNFQHEQKIFRYFQVSQN